MITTRENLWRGSPFKPLTHGLMKTGGRNNSGKVTSWHRGGGAKRLYRCIDFVRSGKQGPGIIERLEYDPNRSSRIALVRHPEGRPWYPSNIAIPAWSVQLDLFLLSLQGGRISKAIFDLKVPMLQDSSLAGYPGSSNFIMQSDCLTSIYHHSKFSRFPRPASVLARYKTSFIMGLSLAMLLKGPGICAVMEKDTQATRKDMFSYMLAPQTMKAGDSVLFGPAAPIRIGNTLPLSSIPLGAAIHNVELRPGRGGQMARSAGTSCTLISRGQLHTYKPTLVGP